MKYKRIVVLASVCAVLGLGVYFSGQKNSSVSGGKNENPGIEDPSKIAGIKIKSKDSEANLVLKDGAWKVLEKQDFPADFNAAKEVVSQFQEMKIDRSFNADEETLKRIGLAPESGGEVKTSSVVFSDSQNKPITEYLIGSARKGGGQYFMKKDSNSVFLSLKEISGTGKSPKDLMNRQVINADKSKIVKIFCEKSGQIIYTLEKQKDSDQFSLTEKEEGKEIETSKIVGLVGFISPFMIEDLAAEKRMAAANAGVLVFELKDGSTCKVIPAEKKDGDADSVMVNIEVSKKDGDIGLQKGLDLEKYTFTIPKWKQDVIVTDKAGFYKQAPVKPAGEAAKEGPVKVDQPVPAAIEDALKSEGKTKPVEKENK
ncbi:DUF4340 domain-containing protein [Desulforegula conservatrix]|uniref:DUF4340 domain-containing protein n=1 Tax=Desulforegula conservatrix TaxID=153026 RepID=UPI00040BC253|nr:DUF4340 domain-containing protein [Desulforegula conservatrix]